MSVKIIGAAMTRFGRLGQDLRALTTTAAAAALHDAGVSAEDVEMVCFGNAVEGVLRGQEMIRAEVLLRHSGLRGVPMLNVENACASSSSAFQVACMAVRSGSADCVLVLGAEQLTHDVKARSFAAVATAVDLSEHVELRGLVQATLLDEPRENVEVQRSPLMDLYAAKVASYAEKWGITEAEMAQVSVKNRFHASLNPKAQFRTAVSAADVLASRMVADPLRLLMCAPIGDGAAAVVVASEDFARRHEGKHITVESSVMTSNGAHPDAAKPVSRAASAAYEIAGLGPEDIDLAEVHDACSPAELWLYDELGFCEEGGSARLLSSGATSLGGQIPVNTSGGLIGRGHPLGATGCAQLVELADQLRGRAGARQVEGARVALAQNGGGILDDGDEAVAVITILSRDA
jgi:acetyl-CoA acetyltransferase